MGININSNSVYARIAKELHTLDELQKLRKTSKFDSQQMSTRLEKFVKEYLSDVLPSESITNFKENILPGFRSVYSVEIANIKCKQFLYEAGIAVISALRKSVADYNVYFAIAFNKKQEINLTVQTLGEDLKHMNTVKKGYNMSLEYKAKLMESVKSALLTLRGGELYLNNSVGGLLRTLSSIGENLFLPGESKGADMLVQNGVTHACQRLKFYVDRLEVKKFETDEPLVNFNVEDLKKNLESLSLPISGSDESIVDYIKKSNTLNLTDKPDEVLTVAEGWNTLINTYIAALDRLYKSCESMNNRLKELQNTKLKSIEEMIANLDEVYRLTETDEGDNEDNQNTIDAYIKVLSIGIVTYNLYLEYNAYDVRSFLLDLNVMSFIVSVCDEILTHYVKDQSIIVDKKVAELNEQQRMKEEAERQAQIQQQQQQANAQADQNQPQNGNQNTPTPNNNNQPSNAPVDNNGTTQQQANDGTIVNAPANQTM